LAPEKIKRQLPKGLWARGGTMVVRKIALWAVFLGLSASGLLAEEVKISFFTTMPHVGVDKSKEKNTGAVVEFLDKHIGPKMGVTFLWDKEPTTIPRQFKHLEQGERDAVALLVFSPERSKMFSYSRKPFFMSQSALGLMKNSPIVKITTVKDIEPLKIAYCEKFFVSAFMKDPVIKWDLMAHPECPMINMKKLSAGRVDAVYLPDKASLLSNMRLLGFENEMKVVNLPESKVPLHVVFSKQKKDLADRYDAAFDTVNGQALYMTILKKYIDTSRL
jgi:ABC-type amino acid transport substrate-binding protein